MMIKICGCAHERAEDFVKWDEYRAPAVGGVTEFFWEWVCKNARRHGDIARWLGFAGAPTADNARLEAAKLNWDLGTIREFFGWREYEVVVSQWDGDGWFAGANELPMLDVFDELEIDYERVSTLVLGDGEFRIDRFKLRWAS